MRFESDKLIHKGRVTELHVVGVPMKDGSVIDRELVLYGSAAVILPLREDGTVVMIRNWRFAVQERLLELPAGRIDEGEEPAAGAHRDLAEETGFTAGRMELLGWYYSAPGTSDEKMYAFLATDLRPGPQKLERYEQIDLEPVRLENVKPMIADGSIHDAKTIAAFALYWMKAAGGSR